MNDSDIARIVAHRGSSGVYAENTRAAFLHGIAEGADQVETDLHLTKDLAVVCSHAHVLEKPDDGFPVGIHELTLDEIRKFDFHTWMGAQIPAEYGTPANQFMTLPELLQMTLNLGQNISLLLEMKEPFPLGRTLEDRVLQDLADFGWTPQTPALAGPADADVGIEFISFDPASLSYLLAAGIPGDQLTGVVSPRRSDCQELIDAGLIGTAAPKWDWIQEDPANAAQVHAWKAQGLKLALWTLNDHDGVHSAVTEFGTDAIITDYPAVAREALSAVVALTP